MAGLTGWHLLVLVLVILLLFGAAKLPALAKSMGQSARVFKGEMKAMKDDDSTPAQTSPEAAQATTAPEAVTKPVIDGGNSNSNSNNTTA